MSTNFVITSAGMLAASLATPTGPFIEIVEFRLGSDSSTAAAPTDTSLAGTTVYTGTPSSYTILALDTLGIILEVPVTAGNFDFGEIGLYLPGGILYARCSLGIQVNKQSSLFSSSPNVLRYTAVVKLAQAPALFQISTANPEGIIELADFGLVNGPGMMLGNPNAVIVNELSPELESVFLWKQSASRWSIGKYNKVASAVLASAQSGSFLLQSADFSPFQTTTPAKYLVQTSIGDVRAVADITGSQLTMTKALAPSLPIGSVVDLYEADSKALTTPLISRNEYNDLLSHFNYSWASPNTAATSFKEASGFGQVPLPLLSIGVDPTPLQLDTLAAQVETAAKYVGLDLPSSVGLSPNWASNLTEYSSKWARLSVLSGLIRERALKPPAFNLQETISLTSTYSSPRWTTIQHDVTFQFSSFVTMAAFFNCGGKIGFLPSINPDNEPQLLQARLFPQEVMLSAGGTNGVVFGDGFNTSSGELGFYGLTSTLRTLYRLSIPTPSGFIYLTLDGKEASSNSIFLSLRIVDGTGLDLLVGNGVAKSTAVYRAPSPSLLPVTHDPVSVTQEATTTWL